MTKQGPMGCEGFTLTGGVGRVTNVESAPVVRIMEQSALLPGYFWKIVKSERGDVNQKKSSFLRIVP